MLQVISEKAEQNVIIKSNKADISGVPTFKTCQSKIISSDYVMISEKVG